MDLFRIDPSAALHDDPFFTVEAGELHHRGNHLVLHGGAHDVFETGVALFQEEFDQHLGFARSHLRVENGRKPRIRVVDHHHRFGVTVAHAAHRVYEGLDAPVGQGRFESRLRFQGA